MSKISELSDGGSLVSSDYLIAVRSGGNVKVRMDQINVDQVDLGDNEFIRLGNSQDLTMVHTSTQSIINQAGIGDLLIQKAGATKLTINATGIDVTGSVTADGLTVAATAPNVLIQGVSATDASLTLSSAGITSWALRNESTDSSLYFTQDGTTRARLASGGDISFYEDTGTTPKFFWDASAESLGIGTSSPNTSSFSTAITVDGSESGLELTDSGVVQGLISSNNKGLGLSGIGSRGIRLFTSASGTATERMRIRSDGFVGIGNGGLASTRLAVTNSVVGANIETTSATAAHEALIVNRQNSDGVAIAINKAGATVGSIGNNGTNLTINGVGALELQENGTTRAYVESTGIHPWANNTYDLGTSGANWKDLYLSGHVQLGAAENISWGGAYNTGKPTITAGSDFIVFYPEGITSGEAMRIDASGNVRMGDNGSNPTDTDADNLIVANASGAAGIQITTASSSVGKLIFGDAGNARSGMVYYSHISNFMRFDTGATERMRLDSAGNLLLGVTSTLSLGKTSILFDGTNANAVVTKTTRAATGSNFAVFLNSSSQVAGAIIHNGATTVNYSSSSDQRLKENIADADDAGAKIDAIQVRKFDWKADGSHQDYGMVAQELQSCCT